MTASGRKRTLEIGVLGVSERPVSGKADIDVVSSKATLDVGLR